MNTSNRQGTPWWMWVLGGCGCLAILVVVGGLGVGWMGVKWVKDTTERMADPEKRDAAALERFGGTELPAPWHASAVFSVPMFADIVVLTDTPETPEVASPGDGEPAADPETAADEPQAEQMLVFASVRDIDDQRNKWREALTNGVSPQKTGLQLPVQFDTDAFAHSSFGLGDSDVTWAAYEAVIQLENGRRPIPALAMAALVDCPGNPRTEIVMWAVPREAVLTAEQPAEALPGKPGDENALRELLELFPVCGPKGS